MTRRIVWLCLASACWAPVAVAETLAPTSDEPAPTCEFSHAKGVLRLLGDCTTTSTIYVPNGALLDGGGFTITARDPEGGHFKGAVVRNAGSRASVRDLVVTVSGLADICDGSSDALRGVLLENASGAVTDVRVLDLSQADGASGCQEGTGIEARGSGTNWSYVHIGGCEVSGFQKNGIAVLGRVRASVIHNTVTGDGPAGHIAQNGILVGWGANAAVVGNAVSGQSYTGSIWAGSGIAVVGGSGHESCSQVGLDCELTRYVTIVNNVVVDSDIGVFLANQEADGGPPELSTRISVVNNSISNEALTNGSGWQVGILDVGTEDRIIANVISGSGYDPAVHPEASVEPIHARPPFALRPVVRANRFIPCRGPACSKR